ncbi:MAG TPA: CHRD domain-containing protein [Noviherbaspirillum sp.]
MQQFRFRLVALLAAFVTVALAGCNGSGDPGSTVSLINETPSTRAAGQELTDAFAATLNGAQVVPMRVTGANGAGTVTINPVSRLMTAVLTTTGIAGTDAHIHQGPPGTIGPIAFPLNETPRGSGIWTATATLTEAQYAAFKAGDFYVDVHSLAAIGGEIRGQIAMHVPGSPPATTSGGNTGTGTAATGSTSFITPSATSTGTFLAALRGTQEVPPNASPALGAGTVLIDPGSRQMTAAISTTGIAGTSAHIHEAPPGANGPVIIPLGETVAGSGVWIARVTLTEDQYNVLKAGNLYFNVHSAGLPAGEIRGQILPQQLSLTGISGVDGNTTGTGATPTATGSGTGGTPFDSGTGGTTGTTGTPGTGTTGTGITGTGLTGTGMTGAGTGIVGFRF